MSTAKGGITQPPALNETVDYEQWKKEVSMWKSCCKYETKQQGPALALSLGGKAKDAVLELELKDLEADTGVDLILTTLDGLFLKDENQRMYVAMKTFEQYTRPKGVSLDEYINEFEKNHNRLKRHKVTFPDQFLAYRLLENANLDQTKNELIRTTIPTLSYKEMKTQLRKLEDVIVNTSSSKDVGVTIKEESDVYYTSSRMNSDKGFCNSRGSGRSRGGFRGGRGGRGGFYSGWRRGSCHNCGSREHYVRECQKPPRNNDNYSSNNSNHNSQFNNNSSSTTTTRNDGRSDDERNRRDGNTEEIRLTL